MPELRKDYILDKYVIIAKERGKRPDQFVVSKEDKKDDKKGCFFCPGNEDKTPPEIYRTDSKKGWEMRVFDNKFPAVSETGDVDLQTHNKFFTFADAVGKHEVVVETPNHSKQLWDLSQKEIIELLNIYKLRINEISKLETVKYVLVFKNHKQKAGTSIAHSHSQIIGYNLVPKIIEQKEEAILNYDNCPYCDIIDIEKMGERKVFETDNAICFTPYASSSPFEAWIFPKRHIIKIDELNDAEISDIALLLSKILTKLKKLNIAFNYFVHYGIRNMHFHIEIVPRTSIRAGFEFGSDTIINVMPPETAAEFYRS
jgi:UDPglucose--hexose-1-phosphate uridylyltransferase